MSIYSISTDKEPFKSLKWVTYLIKSFYRRKLKANCSNKSTFLLKTDPENSIIGPNLGYLVVYLVLIVSGVARGPFILCVLESPANECSFWTCITKLELTY